MSGPEVRREDISMLRMQIQQLEQRLEQKDIESATYQQELLAKALNEKCDQATGELKKLHDVLGSLEKARSVAEQSSKGLLKSKKLATTATQLKNKEPFNVAKLSLVAFYGKGECWVDIKPANGKSFEFANMIDYRNALMGATCLVHVGDVVTLNEGAAEGVICYITPLSS